MPGFNGAGVFVRNYDWTDDKAAGLKVRADRMDTEMDGFATGLSNCICRDGQSTISANLPMNSKKLTGLAAGSSAGDSVRYEQVVLLSAGADQIITRSTTGSVLTIESTEAGATLAPTLTLHRNSASPANNDVGGGINFDFEDDAGNQTTIGRMYATITAVANGGEAGYLAFGVMTGASIADKLCLIGSQFSPFASDGTALGSTTLMWSDLFLASGAVINFNNGNYTVTHTAGILTFSGVVAAASTIELGHASDTTFARASAGVVTVEGNQLCRIKTGTYTGDGATSLAVTGVGFTPKYVKVWQRITADSTQIDVFETTAEILDDNASGMAVAYDGSVTQPPGQILTRINGIIALNADGFTVDDAGLDQPPNKNGEVYNYLCIG